VARHGGYSRVDVLSLRPTSTQALEEALFEPGTPRPELDWALLPGSKAPAEAGVLLRGQPDLAELAWMRRRQSSDRAYSLAGWIHTLAPPAIRQIIAMTAVAPTHPWDALVCTSPAVRANVGAMLDEWGEHLAERTGGRPPPHPALPVIPLGVEAARLQALADRPEARRRVRERMGLAEDEILVLWVGRLSFFEKAFTYGTLTWLLVRAGCSLRTATVLGGLLVLCLRMEQVYLPGRSAEITDVLILVILAAMMKLMPYDPSGPGRRPGGKLRRVWT